MTLKTVVVIGFSTYLNVWFSSVEAACLPSGSDVIQMCRSGTTSGSILYIDANTTVQGNELCSCTATQSSGGQVEILAIRGSTYSSCSVQVDVFKQMPSQYSNIYSTHCLQDLGYTGDVAANTDVMYNLTGPGTINACVMMRTFATGSTITITCSPKIQIVTPIAPVPTTKGPTTQAPITQGPTTQAPITQGPTTQAPITQGPTTQAPITQGPTTQAQSSAPITAAPTTKAPTTPTRTTPSRGPSKHGTTATSSVTRVRTSTVYNKPQTIELTTLGWILGVVGLFVIILILSIVMWFNRHAFRGRHIKQETEPQDVYSTIQERSDENEYQSIDISQSMSGRVYYNVTEALAN